MTSGHQAVVGGTCLLTGGLVGTAKDTLKTTGQHELVGVLYNVHVINRA